MIFDTELNITSSQQISIANETAEGWIGVVSTAWENPANWAGNKIPDAQSNVMIPANTPYQPIVSTLVNIKSLTLMNGARVEVASGANIEVE